MLIFPLIGHLNVFRISIPQTLLFSFKYFESFWVALSSFPLVIQIAVSIITLSTIATIVSIIFVFTIRSRKERRGKIAAELRPKMFSFLRNLLITNDSYTPEEVNFMFEENFGSINKRIYSSVIAALEDVTDQETGQFGSNNYKSIIKGLSIDTYLEKKLDYSDTRTRLKAFRSLSKLQLTISDSKLLIHTFSKNDSLRKESRASYVGVSNNDPFKFFEVINDLNHWDQINLMQQLELHHSDNLPNFSKWIKYSGDTTQKIFFIRMVSHFRQVTSIDTLTDCLLDPDLVIRVEAILAIGKMEIKDIEPRLIAMYFHQPISCQNAIIEAIAYINSGEALPFLKEAYHNINTYDAKRLIAEVIYLYGVEGRQYFNELFSIEKGLSFLTLEHVMNPLIPSVLRDFILSRESDERAQRKSAPIELLSSTSRIHMA